MRVKLSTRSKMAFSATFLLSLSSPLIDTATYTATWLISFWTTHHSYPASVYVLYNLPFAVLLSSTPGPNILSCRMFSALCASFLSRLSMPTIPFRRTPFVDSLISSLMFNTSLTTNNKKRHYYSIVIRSELCHHQSESNLPTWSHWLIHNHR